METRTREERQTVLFLAVPVEVGVRAGTVTVRYADGTPIQADVLGADFTGPDAFMAEREGFDGLLSAARHVLSKLDSERGVVTAFDADRLRAAIARATAPTPTTEG
jgi:hypothetical protein